ncbi:MAG TPA: WYL domain-containing protein, partial [Fibrobacteria bacterium]|nr:WYL domain-containing protein [Fibrobacteria bacterium]
SCLGAFSGDVFEAVFLADVDHAPYVRERRWHPSQRTRELTDGSVEFTLPFGDPGEAARWILGHGPGYRPAAPPELVGTWKRFIQDLSDMAGSGNRAVKRKPGPGGHALQLGVLATKRRPFEASFGSQAE